MAEVTTYCEVYNDRELTSTIGELAEGVMVEILEDFSAQVYKIADNSSNITGWVEEQYLKIPPEIPTDKSVMQPKQLESFVNSNGYISDTIFLLLADINRQKIHVFTSSNQKWKLKKSFDCSTGLNSSPTTRGNFVISERGPWFYSERLSSGAKFWMRFNGQYLIHSIPMDKNSIPIPGEDVVGEKRSNGCIRLLMNDTKWLYDNVPDGTAVIII